MESPSSYLNNLTFDLQKSIYHYLSKEDQIFTMPKVSKVWYLISKQESPNLFEEVAKSLLEREITQQRYSNEKIDIIIEFAKKNNLISSLISNNYDCHVGRFSCAMYSTNIRSTKNELNSLVFSGDHNSYDGYSSFFTINWNPNTFLLSKGKWGDFRSSYALCVDTLKITYQKKIILKNLKLRGCFGAKTEKAHLFSWKPIEDKDIKPLKMDRLIENALTMQLRMYGIYLAHLNLSAISENDIQNILNSEIGLSFNCNNKGRIIKSDAKEGIKFTVKIEKLTEEERFIPVLIWNSSDYHSEEYCTVTDLLRWSVFSLTAEKLTKKMELEIYDVR